MGDNSGDDNYSGAGEVALMSVVAITTSAD